MLINIHQRFRNIGFSVLSFICSFKRIHSKLYSSFQVSNERVLLSPFFLYYLILFLIQTLALFLKMSLVLWQIHSSKIRCEDGEGSKIELKIN